MTSEHHGGFPGYLPNPLQMAAFILDESPLGWAAACPLLLPLRPTAMVAEEVAWLAARHPGRVGLGVAAGALPLDFEAMDRPAGLGRARSSGPSCPGSSTCCGAGTCVSSQGDPALQACVSSSRSGPERGGVAGRGPPGGPQRRRHPDGGHVPGSPRWPG